MVTMDEEYHARKDRLKKESDKLLDDIKSFDSDKSHPRELVKLYEKLDSLKEEYEDLICEIEVEHFLAYGAGYKKDV